MLITCDHPPLDTGSPLDIRMHGDCRRGQMLYYTVKGRTMFRDKIFFPQSVFNLQRVKPVTRGQGLTPWRKQNPNKLGLKREKDLLPTAGNKSWGRGITEKQGSPANKGSVETSFKKPMHIHVGVGLFTILSMPSCSYTPEHARK